MLAELGLTLSNRLTKKELTSFNQRQFLNPRQKKNQFFDTNENSEGAKA